MAVYPERMESNMLILRHPCRLADGHGSPAKGRAEWQADQAALGVPTEPHRQRLSELAMLRPVCLQESRDGHVRVVFSSRWHERPGRRNA